MHFTSAAFLFFKTERKQPKTAERLSRLVTKKTIPKIAVVFVKNNDKSLNLIVKSNP